MPVNAAIFHEYLSRKALELDEKIVRDISVPAYSWVGTVRYGESTPEWFEVREAVRKIVEGDYYVAEKFVSKDPFHFFQTSEPLT